MSQISPEIVGRTRWLQVGKHAGIHGMNAMLKEYGIEPNEEQTKRISREGEIFR